MLHRRFGRTQLQMPVFTCGGMRFQQSWKDSDPVQFASQQNLEACVERALALGINHFETARGYGTSEGQLGRILPKLPRDRILVQTKVGPEADPKKFLENFERSMELLKLDYLDLLALHGINNEERLQWSVRPGGCLDAALELKRQGRVRTVGFSSHAVRSPVLLNAIHDGRFEFVNLHWYYVNPTNEPALIAARERDMGVLIISPNDKGGMLYRPSRKLVRLTAPLSPIVFNDLWCLSRPEIHTLSLGAAQPSDFDEHLKALPYLETGQHGEMVGAIERDLRGEYERVLGVDWAHTWYHGLPDWQAVPGQVNIFEILRLWNLAKAFDMVEYAKMRYNLLGNGDHWFPGYRADKLDGQGLDASLKDSPHAARIPKILAEAHALLADAPVQRLGSH
jgi:predicted aldo/keto reductase-like oxidoreductase